MYCPKCLNDTLKVASSGVVKLTFNGKSKSTSQFFYNLSQDTEQEILEKLENVLEDYFKYYSNFQNQSLIDSIEATSIDFKCSQGCILTVSHKVNVISLIFTMDNLKALATKQALKYNVPLKLKDTRS